MKGRMTMKQTGVLVTVLICSCLAQAQDVFTTRHGQVSFFGKTALENIEAVNNEVSGAVNTTNGEIGFAILVKGFHFERTLMEEHFNENYMESDNIPKALFKGRINNITAVEINKDGTYAVIAEGDLTIHGVTKKRTIPGKLVVKGGQLEMLSVFNVTPSDYNIRIPSLVADKIATSMQVSVDCKYEKK
ncbi:MAG: YceI family protein [Bacteroidota bacterium]